MSAAAITGTGLRARLVVDRGSFQLDIALAVGFADHPSFSRAFARYMGMTPSDYRRIGPL